MATKKISELEAITEADDSDVLAIVDVSEGKTNKITKNNLLIGAGHSIEMSLNENYQIVLKLKNTEGTELSTASIDLPNENAITDISYNNGKLTLTKQSGTTTEVDITGLINGLATETALTNLANAIKGIIGIQTNTYDNTKTYNTGDIIVQNEKIYKANQDNITGTFDNSKWDEISLYEYQKLQDEAIEENYKVITKLQEDVEDLTERMEDAENNQLTNTPTPAISHYLQDSADSRFRKFIPIGRTTQESTTGKQLFDWSKITNVSRDISNGTLNENLENGIICKGNTSSSEDEGANSKGWFRPGDVNTNARVNITEVSNITMSADITLLESGGFANVIRFYLGNGSTTKTSASKSLTLNQKIRLSQTFSNIPAGNWFPIFTLASNKIRIENIMISTSTDINYEPYTGGEPAPNPIYPYAIKNTGDNGSVNEKVQNKNYLPIENIDTTLASVTYKSQNDGTILANGVKYGSNYANLTNNIVTLETDTYSSRMFLLEGSIKKNADNIRPTIYLVNQDDNTKLYYLGEIESTRKTQTIEAGTYFIRIGIWNDNVVFTNAKIGIMLVKGSSIPDEFVPHSEQNISFPLAQGQKFYEGSHPDDDEKVHHNRMQIVLDGSDDEVFDKRSDTNEIRYYLPRNMKLNGKIIANYFMQRQSSSDKNYVRAVGTEPVNTIMFKSEILNTDEMTIPEWRQYLSEHNLILEIDLAEEQTEDFISEQKTAWEEWKKARTYKNVTHISSEDETPANVEIEYVQDTKTYIDNKVTALTNAIISLGGNI